MWTTLRARSRTSVLSPLSHNSLAAHPPEIPEPTTIASKVVKSGVTEALSYKGRKPGAGDGRDEGRGKYMWVTFRCNVRASLFLSEKVGRPLFVEQKIGHDLLELEILVTELAYFARLAQGGALVPAAPAVK